MSKFIIFTDGGFSKTKGKIGSWSFVIYAEGHPERYIHRYGLVEHHKQTSQTAEMLAIINALEFVSETLCSGDIFKAQTISIELTSDSQYCVNGATEWMYKWRRNNWEGKENIDLWKRIYSLSVNTFKSVQYQWVRGHDGDHFNELADLGCNIALGRITPEQAAVAWEKIKA